MKIQTRLSLNTFISFGTVILILLSLVWSWREIINADRNMELVDNMRKVAFERILFRDEYLLYQEERSGTQWHAKSEALKKYLDSANLHFNQEDDRALLLAARKDFDATVSGFSRVIASRIGQNGGLNFKAGFSEGDLRQINQVFLKAYSLTDNINRLHESAQAKAKKARNNGSIVVVLVIFMGVIAIIINSTIIRRTLAKRVMALGSGVEIIGAGNLDYRISLEGDDELTALAQTSNEMAEKLKRSYTSVENLQQEIAERKKAEELLREQEFWLRESQRVGGIGSYVLDFSTNVWRSSSILDDIFGIEHDDEKTVLSWNNLVHPDDREEMLNYFNHCVAEDKKSFNREYRIIRKNDGEVRWLWGLGELSFDTDGKLMNMTGVILDITERKRIEEELRETSEYLNNLIGYANAPIIVWDPQFKITRFNKAFETMTGRKAEDVIGKNLETLFPLDQIEASMELIKRTTGGERWESVEIPILNFDGSTRTVLWNSATIFASHGDIPVATIAQGQDITVRKSAEEALHESEQKLRAAQKMAQLGNWTWDVTTGNVEWSDEVFNIFHLDPNTFTPHIDAILSLSPWPEDHERDKELIHKAIESREKGEYEQRFLRPDGSVGYYISTFQGKYDENGNLIAIVGTIQDITERKLLDIKLQESLADLQRSNKELEQFAYVASHDLQEPLRMVSSYTQLLAERYQDKLDDKANLFIHYAVDGAVRMQLLINDLLAFSRIGTKGKPLEAVNAGALLGQAIINLKMNIEETKTIITNDMLPEVKADASQLVQLFQNLIGNAIKFRGNDNPLIHISAQDSGSEWLFSVKDNGIGIDPQFADKVFIIFQRLHTREEYPGSGIGLAICKKIVERHGGRIWFESEPDKGATFYFTILK